MANSKITLFTLTILVISAMDSLRMLPTSAYFGFSLIFYYLVGAAVFLIPVALISAEFSSRFPGEGGVFHWISHAFGRKAGAFAVWLQWVNTMVWYPTMLFFIAGTVGHLISSNAAENKLFLLIVSLVVFWLCTLFNLRGIETSVRVNSICAIAGTFVPMGVLIALGFWWLFTSPTIAIPFSWKACIPTISLLDNGNALITIMASFLGMELAGVHINDIVNPRKNFPKAIAYSVVILLSILILGALSIAWVVPKEDIHFVDGIMQTFTVFLSAFHVPFLVPVLALLIILGATAGAVNWILSPAKGLVHAAHEGFLPLFFVKHNKHGVAHRLLILQAVIVTALSCAIQFVQSANTYYWFLMTLSTGLYVLMYIFFFLAAIKLKRSKEGYQIPKGLRTICTTTGLIFCIITLILGFQPVPGVAVENRLSYILMITIGFIVLLLPVLLLWNYRDRKLAKARSAGLTV